MSDFCLGTLVNITPMESISTVALFPAGKGNAYLQDHLHLLKNHPNDKFLYLEFALKEKKDNLSCFYLVMEVIYVYCRKIGKCKKQEEN